MRLKFLSALLGASAVIAAGISSAVAEVTVLGWPGGPEEVALRKAAEVYNATAGADDKVKLIFFNREGFWDKLQADLAAGSSEFDLNLVATYSLGKYAPFLEPIDLPAAALRASVTPAERPRQPAPRRRRGDRGRRRCAG